MRGRITIALGGASIAALLMCSPVFAQQRGIISWQDDLSSLVNNDWNYDLALSTYFVLEDQHEAPR